MANVELKKDFKDGQYLYGDDLNNNFKVIEAGINANEENLQDVINQAQDVLHDELVDITTDRGWDWEEEKPIGTRVSFFKGTTQQLEQYEARPGQLLYNVETGETYLEDYGERIVTGSGNTLVVSDEEPTNPGTKVWIKPNELQKVDSTEVIDSLEGNETNLAPSVRTIKNSLNQMKSNIEDSINGTILYDNASGANGTITLSDNATNYNYLEIFYGNNSKQSTRVFGANGNAITLAQNLATTSGWFHIYFEQLRITDNQLVSEMSTRTDFSANSMVTENSDQMKVYRVVGYK